MIHMVVLCKSMSILENTDDTTNTEWVYPRNIDKHSSDAANKSANNHIVYSMSRYFKDFWKPHVEAKSIYTEWEKTWPAALMAIS